MLASNRKTGRSIVPKRACMRWQRAAPGLLRCGARHSHKEASMSRLMVTAIAVGCTFGSFAAQAADFSFKTLDDPADPTFNQLLGINDSGVIAGYFGSGDAGHPNKGSHRPTRTSITRISQNRRRLR